MKTFKKILGTVNMTITTFCFGSGIAQLFDGNYQTASWCLFGVSILFMIGYFAERCSK